MKIYFKKILKFLVLLLVLILPFLYLTHVKADSGWDSGYDSGGYSSGGYDSWDYDYDSGHSSESSGGLGSALVYFVFFLAIAVGLIIKGIYSGAHKIYNDVNEATGSDYNDISDEKLKEILPNYGVDELKQIIYDKYINILKTFAVLNEDKLKPLCDDEIYELYLDQIRDLKFKQLINIKNDFEIRKISLVGAKKDNDEIKVTIYIKTSYYDYTMNIKTKELVSGSKDKKITESTIVDFVYVNNDFLIRNKRNVNKTK